MNYYNTQKTLKEIRDGLLQEWTDKMKEFDITAMDHYRKAAALVMLQSVLPQMVDLYDVRHIKIMDAYLQDIYTQLSNSNELSISVTMRLVRELKAFVSDACLVTSVMLYEKYPTMMNDGTEAYNKLDNMVPQKFD